jgi:hypothetical protein
VLSSLCVDTVFPWAWIFLIAALIVAAVCSAAAASGMSPEAKKAMGIAPDSEPAFQLVVTSPDKGYTGEQVLANAPDILSLEVAHPGLQRLLFRVKFAHRVRFDDGSLLHFYLDLDNDRQTGRADAGPHEGVDIMVTLKDGTIGVRSFHRAFPVDAVFAGAFVDHDTLYMVFEAPSLGTGETIEFTVHLLAERYASGNKIGESDSTPRQLVKLARQKASRLGDLDRIQLTSLSPATSYRYADDKVKYEALENKGLSYEAAVANQDFTFGRPRPLVPFNYEATHPGRAGSIARRRVEIELLEEAGVDRQEAAVTFGFPLPKGGVYDLAHFRLSDPDGEQVSAQFTATSFWPDGSLKWVLIDFTDSFEANEKRVYTLDFGSEIRRAETTQQGVTIEENDDVISVNTGPLQAQINKQTFKLFDGVWIEGQRVAFSGAVGVGLVNEYGKLFTTSARPPESVRVEEAGHEKVVIRVEGKYGADDGEEYMRYVTRLTFRAGSTRVGIAHTHINDFLETEFTDITSLYMPIEMAGTIKEAQVFTGGQKGGLQAHGVSGGELRAFQSDEKTLLINGKVAAQQLMWVPGMSPGVVSVSDSRADLIAVVHEFQERWPKGLATGGNRLTFELLPEQPDAEYGTDLPFHLMYPFVSGKYRFKWGMSFTQRITIDFAGAASPEEMAAEGRLPLVAVIPAEWHSETKALGSFPVAGGERMAIWNDFVSKSYDDHIERKRKAREFGYFNYGDWFGERGRNWGNNEYDLAHGFFMEFIRTGNRDYYRLALAAARHQADVDIIHASPDPTFIGANAQHGIGHTGVSYQVMPQATWSKLFDVSFKASNGHTWADGMMDAWYLAGEARVMEAALALGEHIAWAMAPEFRALGNHERTAGWSLKALTALFRGTYDPVYMKAAEHIASIALKEQDLEVTGAWPHVLPSGHDGWKPGAIGNNLYLIGILLSGLQAYHAETGDPEVLRSIEAGVEWVLKSWNPQRGGWPYSAETDGTPLYEAATGLNMLVVPAIAYVGSIRGDDRLMEVADAATLAHVKPGPRGDGKSAAQSLHFAADVLARLSEWRTPPWIQFTGEMSENAVLKGSVPLGIRIAAESPEDIAEIKLILDGEQIFTGTDLTALEDYMLDTMALDDGMHELTVTVVDRVQGPTTKTVAFRVRNWWSLDDRLQAPIMAFGFELERLQTEDKSDGWQYAGDDSQTFFDDVDRLTREIASREYLTWSAPALQECEVIVYARSQKVTGGVVLSVSADGTQWQDVSYETQVLESSSDGWQKLSLRYAVSDSDTSIRWFRVTFTEDLPSDVQLGKVSMRGLRVE